MKLNEILNKYNISDATLRNWKRLKYIDNIEDIDPAVIDDILKNKVGIRRNKRSSDKIIIPESYVNDKQITNIITQILDIKKKYNVSTNEVLHEAIISILTQNEKAIPDSLNLILNERTNNTDFINDFNTIEIKYNEENDFLGCLYMSLISVGQKDTNGIFYTPYKVVDKIVSSITFAPNSRIVDPGCGSGNFLIQAYKKMKKNNIPTNDIIQNLYGYDIDEIAVLLAKINIYILDNDIVFENINIFVQDFLNDDINETFDVIIGNPPWGKKYTREEKEKISKKYSVAFSKMDSFSQFMIKSFDILNPAGTLGFVLPSSILNIAVHKDIREFLLRHKINSIQRIGREFEEIVTDVIVINVSKEDGTDNVCKYDDTEIFQRNFKENPNSNFLISSTIALNILNKIKVFPSSHLDDNTISYALGVVTGNNKNYLSKEKIDGNEPIISGKEIDKYNINYDKVKNFIVFDKNKFQQVASEEFYRCKNKIIYKFIGKKLCFAVENRGTLTLNSANLICFNDNEDIFYISAILNSRVTQLFFEEMYDTHKLLKNHIQSFYIFNFDGDIKKEISKLSKNTKPRTSYNETIEKIIYEKLNLSKDEIFYLKGRFQ